MPTTITRRISAPPSAASAVPSEAFLWGADDLQWGSGTSLRWGGDEAVAVPDGLTARVSASPVWTFHQQRISFLLALEGDAAGGVLLLEGDAVGDILTDALRLEGDAAVIGGSVTKRILETVA